MLVEAEPERFFRPPYVGPDGCIGIRVDGAVNWRGSPTSSPTRDAPGARNIFRSALNSGGLVIVIKADAPGIAFARCLSVSDAAERG